MRASPNCQTATSYSVTSSRSRGGIFPRKLPVVSFRLRSPQKRGARLHSHKRERSAVKAHMSSFRALARARTGFAMTGSPYGAPLTAFLIPGAPLSGLSAILVSASGLYRGFRDRSRYRIRRGLRGRAMGVRRKLLGRRRQLGRQHDQRQPSGEHQQHQGQQFRSQSRTPARREISQRCRSAEIRQSHQRIGRSQNGFPGSRWRAGSAARSGRPRRP